ncbi:MAG: hypothetical protein NC089_12685 [Bacteroides sp.]|nr:hypothetical protein [Bacteroides sp.]MCM1550932.1 hypothetical protein [Clostridium sp.]
MEEVQEELYQQLRKLEAEEEKERRYIDRLVHMEGEQEGVLFERKQILERELETWSGGEQMSYDIIEEKRQVLASIQNENYEYLEELEQEKRRIITKSEEKRDALYHCIHRLSR